MDCFFTSGPRPIFGSSLCFFVLLATTVVAQQLPPQQLPGPAPAPSPGNTQATPTVPRRDISTSSYQLVRIKDITSIYGHRAHSVRGFGIVGGLQGTGSSSGLTRQAAENLLRQSGLFASNVPTKSIAFVSITGEVPAFHRAGEKFDVRVSALDESVSLYGGNILYGELMTIDGNSVALPGGPVLLGGFSVQGESGGVFKNHVTAGTAEATLEVELCEEPAFPRDYFEFLLRNKDYTTAVRIADAINQVVPGIAKAKDAGSVLVQFPQGLRNNKMEFVTQLQQLRVQPDVAARVIVNQRTGTVMIGRDVRILPTVFAHTNLVISTTENPLVSQPNPLTEGDTVVLPRTQIDAREISSRFQSYPGHTTVGELATILNSLGISPRDFVSILRGLKMKGALQAELIFQ